MENRAQSRQIWEDAMNSQDFDHKDQRIAELEKALKIARDYVEDAFNHSENASHKKYAEDDLALVDAAIKGN